MRYVIDTVEKLADGAYAVADPSLVRGQGYYTGMVFEVSCAGFSGAVAGGGRCDNMVGKFLGQKVPAVGFSIGFERICAILLDQGFTVPAEKKRLALLYVPGADFAGVLARPHSCGRSTPSRCCRGQKSGQTDRPSGTERICRRVLCGQVSRSKPFNKRKDRFPAGNRSSVFCC